MDLPEKEDHLFWEEVRELEEENKMPYVMGVERRALERGQEEGKRAVLYPALEVVLDTKFGAAGRALMPEIRRQQDLAVLEKLLRAVKRAKSVEALRKLLSP